MSMSVVHTIKKEEWNFVVMCAVFVASFRLLICEPSVDSRLPACRYLASICSSHGRRCRRVPIVSASVLARSQT
jgi:hypothetical protein